MKPGRRQWVLGNLKQEGQASHAGQLLQVKAERKGGSGPRGFLGEGPGVPGGRKGQCKRPEVGTCLAGMRSSNRPVWLEQRNAG